MNYLQLIGFKWQIEWEGIEEMRMTFHQADLVALRLDYTVVTDT